MSLDKDTINFIVRQNEILKNDLRQSIEDNGVAVRGTVREQIDRVDEMDKIRNGKIGRNEEDIEMLQCETRFSRWMQRNPKVSIIGVMIIVAGIALGAYQINIKPTIERMLKIELKNGHE